MSDHREGKVTLVRPGRVLVDLGSETVSAFVRGGLKSGPRQARHVLAVGDDVRVDLGRGDPVVAEILPRRNRVSRVAPGDPKAPVEHVLAAYIDGDELVASVDGEMVWRGKLPKGARSLVGPAGLRSDNVRFDGQLLADGDFSTPARCD